MYLHIKCISICIFVYMRVYIWNPHTHTQFERIAGGKQFNVEEKWFTAMLTEIGQKHPAQIPHFDKKGNAVHIYDIHVFKYIYDVHLYMTYMYIYVYMTYTYIWHTYIYIFMP